MRSLCGLNQSWFCKHKTPKTVMTVMMIFLTSPSWSNHIYMLKTELNQLFECYTDWSHLAMYFVLLDHFVSCHTLYCEISWGLFNRIFDYLFVLGIFESSRFRIFVLALLVILTQPRCSSAMQVSVIPSSNCIPDIAEQLMDRPW